LDSGILTYRMKLFKSRQVFFLLLFSFLLISSCTKDEDVIIEETENILSTYDLEVIDYFKQITLGFEFGNATEVTRRFETPIKLFVDGNKLDYLMDELSDIIAELNDIISDVTSIELVDTKNESNYQIFFGTHIDFGNLYPSIPKQILQANLGYFNIFFDNKNEITNGYMYVDTERTGEIFQRHLLREELTQSLGLAKDSDKYSDSIFQAEWTNTTGFSMIDEDIIELLYHPDMRLGLGCFQVENVLENILKK